MYCSSTDVSLCPCYRGTRGPTWKRAARLSCLPRPSTSAPGILSQDPDPQRGPSCNGCMRMSNLASRIAKDWPDLLNCLYCMSKRVFPYRFLAYENGQDSLDIQLLDLARFVMFQKRSYWRQLKKYRSENNPVIIVMLFNRLNIVYPMLFKLSNKQEEYSLLKYYVTYIGCDSIRRE